MFAVVAYMKIRPLFRGRSICFRRNAWFLRQIPITSHCWAKISSSQQLGACWETTIPLVPEIDTTREKRVSIISPCQMSLLLWSQKPPLLP